MNISVLTCKESCAGHIALKGLMCATFGDSFVNYGIPMSHRPKIFYVCFVLICFFVVY